MNEYQVSKRSGRVVNTMEKTSKKLAELFLEIYNADMTSTSANTTGASAAGTYLQRKRLGESRQYVWYVSAKIFGELIGSHRSTLCEFCGAYRAFVHCVNVMQK